MDKVTDVWSETVINPPMRKDLRIGFPGREITIFACQGQSAQNLAMNLRAAAERVMSLPVYELCVVDPGGVYDSVALLPNLREAIRFARETEPHLLDEYAEEHVCVEIRERPMGRANSDGCYNIVATVTHELCDDDEWEVTTSYRTRWLPHAWVREDGSEPSERRWNGTGYEEHRGYPLGHCALFFREELV
jgi:hypothetical protein